MISFDACSLFTMVPLDYTIDLTLKRIYGDNKIENNISRKDWKNLLLLSTKICCYYPPKNLLLLCTKNVHFTFENKICQQKNGVAMGSPLGPVLRGIFMVHLERTLMPKLEKFVKPWKRYADDTITYIKPDFITDVIDIVNKFHEHSNCLSSRT